MNYSVKTKLNCALAALLCAVFCISCGFTQNADPVPPTAAPSPAETMSAEAAETPAFVPVTPEPVTPEPVPPEPVTSEPVTPEPSPTPVPVSDEQLDEGFLDAWFDDSVLIGDSLVAGLNMYVTKERSLDHFCLGNMQLVGTSALSLKKALGTEKKERTGEIKFRGRYTTASDVVKTLQAKRVFFMLGVNDPRWYSPEELVDVYDQIITIVRTENPGIRVYIHSLMPMIKSYADTVDMTYEINKAANDKLRAYCEENDVTYLELADLVRDENGFLRQDYSAQDNTFHLNSYGKAIWVHLLRSCARDEYNAGIWSPEDAEND